MSKPYCCIKFGAWIHQILIHGAPRAKPVVPKRRQQGANIPYQRTNSPTGRTRGPLGSG
jgi:hypothetical protein